MKPIWVVDNCRDRQTVKVVAALQEAKEPFILADINPATLEFEPPIQLSQDYIPYGSTSLMKIAKARNWPFYFTNDNFNVAVWAKKHTKMLNNDAVTMTLSAAKAIAEQFRASDGYFVRPLDDNKSFAGMVLEASDLVKWVNRLDENVCDVNSSTLIALSKPKHILAEWRYFIVDSKIVSGSMYRLRGQSTKFTEEDDSKVLSEAQNLANEWLPHPCCVMDIALADDDKPYIIEFNGINASGFYGHNVTAIVKAVGHYACQLQSGVMEYEVLAGNVVER